MKPNQLFDLSGKVAIVTGSSRGIGFESAKAMAAYGAKVVICGRHLEPCVEAAELINRDPGSETGAALALAANISRKEELQSLVDRTVEQWGKIDIVMANAAIHPWVGSVLDVPDDTFTKFFRANLQSSLWLSQLTLPGMIERGYGRFIVVASIVGILGDPLTGTYGLTKAGDMQLVRNIAMEFAAKGVCANCIAPGTFKTEMARSFWDVPEMVEWNNRRNPSQRFGELHEIAGVAVMLASPAGGYINGQTIPVDGGHSISYR